MWLFTNVNKRNFVLASVLFVIIVLTILYIIAFKPNIQKSDDFIFVKIPTHSTINDVYDLLEKDSIVRSIKTFKILAQRKNYANHVYPGRYKVHSKMSNNKLINLLRSGKQEPLNVVINTVRSLEKLAKIVSLQIEADSAEIFTMLHDTAFLRSYDFTPVTVYAAIIPNTYEFFWNTNAKDFMKRMMKEYERFWNDEREKHANELSLTKMEVSILASIIDQETIKSDEMPRIAGVYMNRLQKKIRLQADPTVKFALGDYEIKRVLRKHLRYDSPYNTYIYRGLPPGPISIPSIAAIDAVLLYERHDYIYMCAKEDFSGYHYFAKSLREHLRYARKYQRALNEKKILN
ncbi:endolytic transglycosylase MltG [Bacteroidota bacterium]